MLKLADNPPMLHPTRSTVRQAGAPWWVVHTKSRNEKALAWELVDLNVWYYLPMVQRTIFSGGRRRTGLLPLFPSYVFVSGDSRTRDALIRTDRICSVIPVPDQQQLVDELSAIERVLADGQVKLDLTPFAVVGKRVRIARGPFKGITGLVVRRDNLMRLALQVSILGRGAEMDIDSDLLEEIDE